MYRLLIEMYALTLLRSTASLEEQRIATLEEESFKRLSQWPETMQPT